MGISLGFGQQTLFSNNRQAMRFIRIESLAFERLHGPRELFIRKQTLFSNKTISTALIIGFTNNLCSCKDKFDVYCKIPNFALVYVTLMVKLKFLTNLIFYTKPK